MAGLLTATPEKQKGTADALILLGVVPIGGLVHLVALGTENFLTTLSYLLLATAAIALLRSTGKAKTAAPYILVGFPLIVGWLGFLFYESIADVARVSASIPTTPELYKAASNTILIGTAAALAGLMLAFVTARRPPRDSLNLEDVASIKLPIGALLLAAWLPLVVLVYGKGDALLRSGRYLEAHGPLVAVSIGNSLTLAALLAASIALFRGSPAARFTAWVALAAWVIVLFATSTRQLALLPGLMVVAYILSPQPGRRSRPSVGWLALVAVLTLSLLQLALALRNGTPGGHGLFPYLAALLEHPGYYLTPNLGETFGNLLFSVPLTGLVALTSAIPGDALWTSLSPLLGGMTDWPTLSRALRVNIYTPFNGFGELANHGTVTLVIYMLVAGFIIGRADLSSRWIAGAAGVVAMLAVAGLALLFTLDLLQYNLRSATRVLYYLTFLLIFLRVTQPSLGTTPKARSIRRR